MKILIACEFSGTVRDACIEHGADAVSCDLLPSERPGPHIQDDVLNHLNDGFDAMIAFPPCTHLAVSGAAWFYRKEKEQAEALNFVRTLMDAPIEKIAVENPIGVISTKIRKPDQIIQPYWFGADESKKTCLWLKGFPLLVPTDYRFPITIQRAHYLFPRPDRWKIRSLTYLGIAQAMAKQWT